MGFGKDGKGVIIRENTSITLGTLANGAAIKATGGQLAITEDFRIIKTEYLISFEGKTADENIITIGLADNELSVTEIAECLAVDGPLDRNDHLKNEQVMRPVWELAQLGAGTNGVIPDTGLPGERNLRWTFSDTDGWTWFAYNESGAALTTGTVVRIRAKHFGVWVT